MLRLLYTKLPNLQMDNFPSFFKRFSRIAEQLFSIEDEERDYIAGNTSMRFSD
jgi:hypothetical protein